MSGGRSCADCTHCDQWVEHGTPMSDCHLVTLDSKRVSDGNLSTRQYENKHAVYLTAVDCGADFDMTAVYCPNFFRVPEVIEDDKAYALCGEDFKKLVAIQKLFADEAYPLGLDIKRDLAQRFGLVLDNVVELEGDKV